ncbi:MAG: hypothetical protein IKH59_03360 [Bacteroidaceae bacterium]|nr:hypothetical protein [Bacteroidaceae bacterium]
MAEMKIGYGSEYQLLRYLGHHRKQLNSIIQKTTGEESIEWFDYPVDLERDSLDGELKDIECFRDLDNYYEIQNAWKNFWPQRGNAQNWDAVFKQGQVYYFVEAKANIEEAFQKCEAREKSRKKIIGAFERVCGSRILAEKWINSNCYQLANRLAFVYFCKSCGIQARTCYISFINGYEICPRKNVCSQSAWEECWKKEYEDLELTEELKSDIIQIYVDCHKGM